MGTGIEIIQKERQHQLDKGWSTEHDQQHRYADLAVYAAVIAVDGTDACVVDEDDRQDRWGLIRKYKKEIPDYDMCRVKLLSIAGAFLAAEIDRTKLRIKGRDNGN